MLCIFFFSLGQFHLSLYYLKGKKKKANNIDTTPTQWPYITVQLPVYNEQYVVERLIDAVAAFDYPLSKLEIQVLDDSTDKTVEIAQKKVSAYQKLGLNIQHIRRDNRQGYKAGALQRGMEQTSGEFLAIFDADFIPEKDFLKRTISAFTNPKIGVIQTRWGHLNKDYSMLTRLQAFGLDAHFSIEQAGRHQAGSYINFNGTGGVWRKSCIIDAGGWSCDTLTEDLDLSYRAQMRGWKFKYLEDCVSPAELPVIMPAVKSQQYRWNKGAAETARKHLGSVLRSSLKTSGKIHAFFHLLNSSVFLFLLVAAMLSIPMLFVKEEYPRLKQLIDWGSIFIFGFAAIAWFYWISSKQSQPSNTFKYYITTFPAFLAVSMGLSLHNGIAVLEGWLGVKSPFIRTPKFNIITKKDSWKNNVYIRHKVDVITLLEGVLCLYFLFGISAGIYLHDWGLLVFHLMLTTGFGSVFYHSVKPMSHAKA